MTNVRALTRVQRDLASGHSRAAIRRLRTMLAVDPEDIEIRCMLAEIYRREGNTAEAGRWGYLTDRVTDDEIAAFERAHPQPWNRLKMLNWSGQLDTLPSAATRARLIDLRKNVSEMTVQLQHKSKYFIPSSPSVDHEMPAITDSKNNKGQKALIPRQRKVDSSLNSHIKGSPYQRVLSIGQIIPSRKGAPNLTRRFAIHWTLSESTRLYLILGTMITFGTIGSIIVIGIIRALFGFDKPLSPVQNLMNTIIHSIFG